MKEKLPTSTRSRHGRVCRTFRFTCTSVFKSSYFRKAAARMICFSRGRMAFATIAAAAVATLVVLTTPDAVQGFGLAPAAVGNVQSNVRQAGTSSSFLKARSPPVRAGESSPTSLSSSYEVKPEMARCRGAEWRKLRTRGPGFGEKVRPYFLPHFHLLASAACAVPTCKKR